MARQSAKGLKAWLSEKITVLAVLYGDRHVLVGARVVVGVGCRGVGAEVRSFGTACKGLKGLAGLLMRPRSGRETCQPDPRRRPR